MKKLVCIGQLARQALLISLLGVLAACGGGGGGGGGGSSNTTPGGSSTVFPPKTVVENFAGRPLDGVDGQGAAASFADPRNMVRVGDTLYVTDQYRIRKVALAASAVGKVETFAGQSTAGSLDDTGTAARFKSIGSMGRDTAGKYLYVLEREENTSTDFRQIDVATGKVKTLFGNSTTNLRDSNYFGLVADNDYIYVGSRSVIHRIKISDGSTSILAGNQSSTGFMDGLPDVARFYGVSDLALSKDGATLYAADCYNNKIRKIDTATGVVSTPTWTGYGSPLKISMGNGYLLVKTDLSDMYAINLSNNQVSALGYADGSTSIAAGEAQDDWYVVKNSAIYRGISDAAVAGAGSLDGATGKDARFNAPRGAVYLGGYLYVADTRDHTIRKVTPATGASVVLTGKSGVSGDIAGDKTTARLNFPEAMATDGTSLFVSSYYALWKVDTSGTVTKLLDLAANNIEVYGMVADATYLYVTDAYKHIVYRIPIADASKKEIWAGALNVSGSTDGARLDARFNYPIGLTLDSTYLYVADHSNNMIRKIELKTGVVSTVTITHHYLWGAMGTPSKTIQSPLVLAVDKTNLYMVESYGGKLRKIELTTGIATVLIGTDEPGSYIDWLGYVDWARPPQIALDGLGTLYATNTSNSIIRKVSNY